MSSCEIILPERMPLSAAGSDGMQRDISDPAPMARPGGTSGRRHIGRIRMRRWREIRFGAGSVAPPSWPSPGLSGGSSAPSVAARAGRDGPNESGHDDTGKILLRPPPYPDTHGS